MRRRAAERESAPVPQTPDHLDLPTAGPMAIRGSAARLAAYALTVLIGVAATALLFRHLGVADSGRYVTVLSLVVLFGGVSDAGLTTIGVRELAGGGAVLPTFFSELLGLRIVTAVAGIGLAVAAAFLLGYSAVMVAGTALAGVAFVLQSLQTTVAAPLMRDLRLGVVAVLDVVRQAVAAAAIVTLVLVGASLLPFFAAGIPAGIIVLLLTIRFVRGVAARPTFFGAGWRVLVRDTLPYAAAIAVASIYFRLAVVLVSVLATTAQTGYFAASFRVVEVLVAVPQLAIGAAFPVLARAATTNAERFVYIVRRLFDASVVLGAWIALVLGVGAAWVVDVVAGPKFGPAADVLRIQGIAMLASFVAALWGYALLAVRRHSALLTMSAVPLVVSAIATAVLTVAYASVGAAVATVLGELSMAVTGAVLLARAEHFSPVAGVTIARVAVAAGAGALAAWSLPDVPGLVGIVVATVVYVVVLVVVRGIPTELVSELRSLRPSAAP
jgi:O-antigen/teichoic acid export membrane protein